MMQLQLRLQEGGIGILQVEGALEKKYINKNNKCGYQGDFSEKVIIAKRPAPSKKT